MKINLNDLPYTKPIISRENILKEITEWDIFKKYIPDLKIKEVMSSPFRKDTTPSFAVYISSNGDLLYNDFVLGGGNCFQFVKYLFNYTSWHDVYSRIAIDFWLDHKYYCSKKVNNPFKGEKPETGKKPVPKNELDLAIKVRTWETYDQKYWKSNGISIKTLIKYNVHPIEYIIFKSLGKESIIKADKYAYAYVEKKDGKTTYKIYQPFSKYKWFGNVDTSIWQGWEQLPSHSDILILTKSLKDVMAINENCQVASVSLQSEKIKPKINVINQIKRRFSQVYVLYDNDFDKKINYGQTFAGELCDEFDLINLRLPEKYKCKDFTDLINKTGADNAIKILSNLIEKYKPKRCDDIPF